ncbi:MAG: MotE family protein [Rhizobiaceae bacterium]|nr:MotE family protein [Rhizobiaceae bacterium]
MKYLYIVIATFAVSLMFAGSQVRAQAPKEERPDRIDILAKVNPHKIDALAKVNPNKIDTLATGSIGSKADISGLVVGAVLNNNDMLSYCLNISDAATEARNSILQKMMKETEVKITDKLVMLEAKTALLQEWVGRRDNFMRSANKSLVTIFETMRPDAAASQIAELKLGLAAAIILKLQPKISSAIMTEIPPKHAAKIAAMLTSAIDISDTQGNVNVNNEEKMAKQ